MSRAVALAVAAALLVLACSDTTGPLATDPDPARTDAPTVAPTPDPATPTVEPTPDETSPSPATTDPPVATPTPSPAGSPAASPGDSPDPNASPTAPSEAVCTGSDDNRAFFAAAAVVLAWDVYCAVLPSGWFVSSGQYRQANGGFLEIGYRGPGGRTLDLREGAFCTEEDGCVPDGSAAGAAAFGALDGTLIALDGGGWAVVVAPGETLSWFAIGTGLDETAFRELAGALHRVTP